MLTHYVYVCVCGVCVCIHVCVNQKSLHSLSVGHDTVKEAILLALVAREHVYVEGPPGTGKTMLAETTAELFGGDFFFYQFHRDTRLAELIGDTVLIKAKHEETGGQIIKQMNHRGGILTCNMCVLDDISRAPGESLNILLRVLNERKFQGDPIPLLTAIATGNPSGDESYYNEPLDPANLDRFVLQVESRSLIQDQSWDQALKLMQEFGDSTSAPESVRHNSAVSEHQHLGHDRVQTHYHHHDHHDHHHHHDHHDHLQHLHDEQKPVEHAIELETLQLAHQMLPYVFVPKKVMKIMVMFIKALGNDTRVKSQNSLLSDRTMLVKALKVVKAKALIGGRMSVTPQDLMVLRLVTTFRVPADVHQDVPHMLEAIIEKLDKELDEEEEEREEEVEGVGRDTEDAAPTPSFDPDRPDGAAEKMPPNSKQDNSPSQGVGEGKGSEDENGLGPSSSSSGSSGSSGGSSSGSSSGSEAVGGGSTNSNSADEHGTPQRGTSSGSGSYHGHQGECGDEGRASHDEKRQQRGLHTDRKSESKQLEYDVLERHGSSPHHLENQNDAKQAQNDEYRRQSMRKIIEDLLNGGREKLKNAEEKRGESRDEQDANPSPQNTVNQMVYDLLNAKPEGHEPSEDAKQVYDWPNPSTAVKAFEDEKSEASVENMDLIINALSGRMQKAKVSKGACHAGMPRRWRSATGFGDLDDSDAAEVATWAEDISPKLPRAYERSSEKTSGELAILRDISGSMNGIKAKWASEVITRLINIAKQNWMRVGYIEFNHQSLKHTLEGQFFSRDHDAVCALACRVQCEGYTNYQDPLKDALMEFQNLPLMTNTPRSRVGKFSPNRHILFLTDGLPNQGDVRVSVERQLAHALGVAVHTVFIGYRKSPLILDLLSQDTQGERFRAVRSGSTIRVEHR